MYQQLLTVFQKHPEYRDFSTVEILFDVLFYKYLQPSVDRNGLSESEISNAKKEIIETFCNGKKLSHPRAALVDHLKRSIDVVISHRSAYREERSNKALLRLQEILANESGNNDRPSAPVPERS